MIEINKENIDKNKDQFIDINEINNFIFDENEWEKNLNDIWNYLNNLERNNNDQILITLNNFFNNTEEWKNIEKEILQNISKNKPLNKKELSLIYINMIVDRFRTWQMYFNFIKWKLSDNELNFDITKPINQICNWKLIQFIQNKYTAYMYTGTNSWKINEPRNLDKEGIFKKWWNEISEDMFQQLLQIEWSQGYVSKIMTQFWEKFPTWPYGMVYKHIDKDWNLLKKPIPFKNWEKVTKERALKNAKTYYNKKAQERKDLLDKEWCEYNQAQLDSLVSASWWTKKSVDRLQNFVLSHREHPSEISDFISKFATTSAGNWQIQPWLVIRRQLESNRFNWIEKPLSEYQKEWYQNHSSKHKKRK